MENPNKNNEEWNEKKDENPDLSKTPEANKPEREKQDYRDDDLATKRGDSAENPYNRILKGMDVIRPDDREGGLD